MDPFETLAAAILANSATLTALLDYLKANALLPFESERQVYLNAIKMVQDGRAASPHLTTTFDAARELISQRLELVAFVEKDGATSLEP